jgi:hypothetical protein
MTLKAHLDRITPNLKSFMIATPQFDFAFMGIAFHPTPTVLHSIPYRTWA